MSRIKDLEEKYYPERRFGGYSRVDGTIEFFRRVHSLVAPGMTALDVGCGRGAFVDRLAEHPWEKCRILKGACQKVIGIDVSEAGRENPVIDEFRLIEGDHWPIDSASIDLLVADAVLEHLPNPDLFFAECNRVVKPGGVVCFRTPNRWGYASIIASIVPNRLHARIISIVQPGRKEPDVFPTYYRANTLGKVRRLLKRHNFDGCAYRHLSEPNYLMFSPWAYSLGVYLHRWLPQFFWHSLLVFGRRIEEPRSNA